MSMFKVSSADYKKTENNEFILQTHSIIEIESIELESIGPLVLAISDKYVRTGEFDRFQVGVGGSKEGGFCISIRIINIKEELLNEIIIKDAEYEAFKGTPIYVSLLSTTSAYLNEYLNRDTMIKNLLG